MTAFLMLTFFTFNYTFEMLSVVLMILINFAFCVMVLKGKLLEKAFVVVFLMGLVGIVANGTALLFGYMYSVVLFGNLLDNAIEAAERTSEKRIEIDISRHDKYVMISVSNSIECAVLGTNPKLLTSKADKKAHGFGTRNIQKIVEKYQGILQYSERENTFICDIMLPIITNYVPKPTKLVQTIEI